MQILSLPDIRQRAILSPDDPYMTEALLKGLTANLEAGRPGISPVSAEKRLNYHCKKLIEYLSYQDEIVAFNEEIKAVMQVAADLDDIRVRNWCLKARYLFNEVFFSFGLDFCDHTASTEEYISLNVDDYFVRKKDIMDLCVFSDLNWILHSGHTIKLPKREYKRIPVRKKPTTIITVRRTRMRQQKWKPYSSSSHCYK